MSFFGRLLGSEKAIESISSGIDKSILTPEEKADLKIEVWKAAHPFKAAQRFFMLLVVIPYMIAWTVNTIYAFMGVESDLVSAILTGRVGDVFLAMAIFYFGGGALNTLSNFKK
jgi:hypothetical protein